MLSIPLLFCFLPIHFTPTLLFQEEFGAGGSSVDHFAVLTGDFATIFLRHVDGLDVVMNHHVFLSTLSFICKGGVEGASN